MSDDRRSAPSVSVRYASNGASTKANALGMRPMQEKAYERRGERHLLIKSPPASGKSRALMFIALDKLANQGLRQAIVVVPERSIGASFADERLTAHGFFADWHVAPRWNLCDAPGTDGGKVNAVGAVNRRRKLTPYRRSILTPLLPSAAVAAARRSGSGLRSRAAAVA